MGFILHKSVHRLPCLDDIVHAGLGYIDEILSLFSLRMLLLGHPRDVTKLRTTGWSGGQEVVDESLHTLVAVLFPWGVEL